MNWLQLVNRLKLESGRSGGDVASVSTATGSDLRLVNWIADAWVELQRRPHGWTFMRKDVSGLTVPDQAVYEVTDLDANIGDFDKWLPRDAEAYAVMVTDANGDKWPLMPRSYDWVVSNHEEAQMQGWRPLRYWAVTPDEKLLLAPTPKDEFTIDASYYRLPVPFTDDTSEPSAIPEQYHMILVWRALMEVASFDAAPEVYARAQMNFGNINTELMKRFGAKATGSVSYW